MNCSFSSSSIKDIKEHLLATHFREEKLCPYCTFKSDEELELVKHLSKHKYDQFQCRYCLYKTRHRSYIIIHQEKYHSSQKINVLIPKYKPRKDKEPSIPKIFNIG